jgi:hypothetical protein
MIEHITRQLTHITLLAAVLYASGANADDFAAPQLSFSGFGTLGVVHSSEDQADFTSSILKPDGAGYSHAWSKDVDSLIGGQVTATITPKLSAVLQVIAEQNYDNTYQPHVEWANIKYQFTPDFSLRVGRTVLPTFLFSGTRKVAYTYPWVRPPLEVYIRVPVTASDGVDASYRAHVGDFTHTVQANYGSSRNTLPDGGGTVEADHAWGITYSVEHQATTLHLAYQRTMLTLDSVKPLFDAFRQFGPQGIAIADKYDADNKPLSIIAVGATYDPGKWFATAEWAHTENHSFLGNGTGWYASSGYRLGKFTPYLTYAQATADNLSDPGLNLSALPPPAAGPAAGLNAALNSLLGQKIVQNTVSIGGRWDFMRNAALKLQYDHTDIGAGSRGVLTNLQPGFQSGGKVNVFSATVDFVF